MKVKDIIKGINTSVGSFDVTIGRTIDFTVYMYGKNKIALMRLPEKVEKDILNMEVTSYKFEKNSFPELVIAIDEIDKKGIYL